MQAFAGEFDFNAMTLTQAHLHLEQRLRAFVELGVRLRQLSEDKRHKLFTAAAAQNPWFTTENLAFALDALQQYLDEAELRAWLKPYQAQLQAAMAASLPVGVVMAGNIPAVGFHDLLCVLMSGHRLLARLSSDDRVLMQFLIDQLLDIEPGLQAQIQVIERLNEAAAYIATGSRHSNRYFQKYFSQKPHILRSHRNGVAVLSGKENQEDLQALGQDIFCYFGLGCRSISKVYVPVGYDFSDFFKAITPFARVMQHHKYANNYDYNKAVFLIKPVEHLDNGFLLLRQASELHSPVAVLHYEYYSTIQQLQGQLKQQQHQIQCIVSKDGQLPGTLPFGYTQLPKLSDYADGIDTMQFLIKLSST